MLRSAPKAGLLGGVPMDAHFEHLTPEIRDHLEWAELPGPVWDFGSGQWFRCGECSRIGIFHSYQWYWGRPCGHYDGDCHMKPIDQYEITDAWRAACNEVKVAGGTRRTNR